MRRRPEAWKLNANWYVQSGARGPQGPPGPPSLPLVRVEMFGFSEPFHLSTDDWLDLGRVPIAQGSYVVNATMDVSRGGRAHIQLLSEAGEESELIDERESSAKGGLTVWGTVTTTGEASILLQGRHNTEAPLDQPCRVSRVKVMVIPVGSVETTHHS